MLRLLPFNETQIRSYFAANLPSTPVDQIMELLGQVHNLRELAERPYLLNLIRLQIPKLNRALAAGLPVRSVDLYDGMIEDWMGKRDLGKHRLVLAHKRPLMRRLAVYLWRRGAKTLAADELEAWLLQVLSTDPVLSRIYDRQLNSEERDTLLEDLRTATFIARWDGDRFQFAHTSLQEFFLAEALFEALSVHGTSQSAQLEWAMPEPSVETFGFLAELRERARSASQTRAQGCEEDRKLCELLERGGAPLSAGNALRFWLLLHQHKLNPPQPDHWSLADIQAPGWFFGGGTRYREAVTDPIDFSAADFCGANLQGSDWVDVHAPRIRFDGANLGNSIWHRVNFERASWQQTRLAGIRARSVRFEGSSGRPVSALGFELDGCQQSEFPVLMKTPPVAAERIGLRHPIVAEAAGVPFALALFDLDGQRVMVSGSDDGTLRYWDLNTGACIRVSLGLLPTRGTAQWASFDMKTRRYHEQSDEAWRSLMYRIDEPVEGGVRNTLVPAAAFD